MGLMGIGTPKRAQAAPKVEAPVDVPKDRLAITEAAAEKAQALAIKEDKADWFLQVAIMGGGCSVSLTIFRFNRLE